jgi:hypothetical protein
MSAKHEQVRQRLQALERDGRLTPDDVVADAVNPDSPLHGEFEWDDSEAANRYRIVQARQLIRSVVHSFETNAITITSVAYVRDPDAGHGEQGYVPVATLKTDKDRARDVLANEAERAAAHLQRVRDLSAALEMEQELDDILGRFTAFRERLSV